MIQIQTDMTHLIFERTGMKLEARRKKRIKIRKIVHQSHTARKNSMHRYQHHCERWNLEVK